MRLPNGDITGKLASVPNLGVYIITPQLIRKRQNMLGGIMRNTKKSSPASMWAGPSSLADGIS